MKRGNEFGANIFILGHKCYRCDHEWVPRERMEIPEICPSCKSPYWKKPKTKFPKNNGEKKKNGK
ncbi:hypothetical protein HYT25_01205 [Candidatus Pacearchaeota archaeon]|nr:hypothetical protein [Candidatus Pacearchaeota archaeon]